MELFHEFFYVLLEMVMAVRPYYGGSLKIGNQLCFCFVVAICMDLPKAFDCLPHDIIISKLAAYEIWTVIPINKITGKLIYRQ